MSTDPPAQGLLRGQPRIATATCPQHAAHSNDLPSSGQAFVHV